MIILHSNCKLNKTHMRPDLRKATFHAHNIRTHFSPSNDSCSHWLTVQAGIDAESLPRLLLLWLVSEAHQMSMSARATFKWLHIPLTSRQSAVIHHMTRWWVWPWIQLLCVICGGKNGTNGCHLAGFSEYVAFACHFLATCLPPTLPLYRSATGI